MGINFQGYGSEIHGQNNDDDPSIQNIPIGNCTSMNIKYGGWWQLENKIMKIDIL